MASSTDWATTAFEEWRACNNGSNPDLVDNLILLESTVKADGSTKLQLLLNSTLECMIVLPKDIGAGGVLISGGGPAMSEWRDKVNQTTYNLPINAATLQMAFTSAVEEYRAQQLAKSIITSNIDSDDDDDDADDDDDDDDDDDGNSGSDANECDLDSNDGDDFDDLDDSAFTTEWELEIARNKKRWLAKDEELRSEKKRRTCDTNGEANSKTTSTTTTATTTATATTTTTATAHGIGGLTASLSPSDTNIEQANQIFSSTSATGVLVNDLVNIMQNKKSYGFSASPINDNIYHWNIKMTEFSETSAICKDLKQLETKFGYNYVELNFEFTMDLFPFYPPSVKVVRPRLKDSMMQRISNLEFFKLTYWNPTTDMSAIIHRLKRMMEDWCELEVDHAMNDKDRFPSGSYYPLEHVLLQLAFVSEVKPRANLRYAVQAELAPRIKLMPQKVKTEIEDGDGDTNYWKAGTGYGSGNASETAWDPDAYQAAKDEKSRQIEKLTSEVLKCCQQFQLSNAGHADNAKPPTTPPSTTTTPPSTTTNLASILEGSCLIPYLQRLFNTDSMVDMMEQTTVFSVSLDVVELLISNKDLQFLLGILPDQNKSLQNCLLSLSRVVSIFLKHLRKGETASTPTKFLTFKTTPKIDNTTKTTGNTVIADRVMEVTKLMEEVTLVTTTPTPLLPTTAATTSLTTSSSSSSSTTITTTPPPASTSTSTPTSSIANANTNTAEAKYAAALQPLQLGESTFFGEDAVAHHYTTTCETNGLPRKPAVLRLAQEMCSLASSLPMNLSSSVFVSVDEDRMDLMKALIVGPEDTPYSGGCFEFDIYFPAGYPMEPPNVNLETTGRGSVRFNPNLYNNGKVCLSLLGTWQGQAGEQWIANSSTFLQVLISIQSLILVPQPYFNEPGYEKEMGTPEGNAFNEDYNQTVRLATMRWAMLEQLRSPPKAFEEVIKTHFKLRRDYILTTCGRWLAEAQARDQRKSVDEIEHHHHRPHVPNTLAFEKTFSELRTLLSTL